MLIHEAWRFLQRHQLWQHHPDPSEKALKDSLQFGERIAPALDRRRPASLMESDGAVRECANHPGKDASATVRWSDGGAAVQCNQELLVHLVSSHDSVVLLCLTYPLDQAVNLLSLSPI